jgi:hypothetical protein
VGPVVSSPPTTHTLALSRAGDILAGLRGRNDSNDDSDGAQESDDEASDGDDDGAADAAAEAEIVAQVKAEPRSGKIYYSMQAALEAGVIFEAGDIVQASCWVEAIIDKPDVSTRQSVAGVCLGGE